jgi:hypothetical protein
MAKENPVLHNSNLWLHSKSDSTAQMLSDSGTTTLTIYQVWVAI